MITCSPVAHMPLVENRDTLSTLVSLCGVRTRLCLSQVCPESKRSVMAAIRKESRQPLAKLGATLSGTLPFIACDSTEVPGIVAAASGEQFLVCASQCCALLFAKCGERWVVAVHCDDRQVVVIGWKQPAAEFSQRPIHDPITEKPTVAVSVLWETSVGREVETMANSGDSIAVGTKHCMALLNAHTGAVVTDTLKGTLVAFLDKERVVGVVEMENEETDEWVLCEFTGNTLTKEVSLDLRHTESMKASANGKRLYVFDAVTDELLQYCTRNWRETARIPLSGSPLGQCDIAANGLLAQGISIHYGDGSYHIDVIESNSSCVTQTIRTKHTRDIFQVVFSPDSSRIASVSEDETVQLFDAISGQMIGEPRVAHSDWVNSVCFLTDDLFVSFSFDNSLVVWHCDSQPPIACIEAQSASVITSVRCLSTDSFVTAEDNGTVKQWKLECK